MIEYARVWLSAGDQQHFAEPPTSEVVKQWQGATACGIYAHLTWIPPERVDGGSAGTACTTALGPTPALEGDHPGPP